MQTLWRGHSSAVHYDMVPRHHVMLSGYVNFLWLLYPIAFALSDGGNVIGVTGSLIFLGILDILLLLGTAIACLVFSRRWDYDRMSLHFTDNGRVGIGSSHGRYSKEQPLGGTAETTTETTPAASTAIPSAHTHAVV
jgi:Bacteriorhodopsin-like protein